MFLYKSRLLGGRWMILENKRLILVIEMINFVLNVNFCIAEGRKKCWAILTGLEFNATSAFPQNSACVAFLVGNQSGRCSRNLNSNSHTWLLPEIQNWYIRDILKSFWRDFETRNRPWSERWIWTLMVQRVRKVLL